MSARVMAFIDGSTLFYSARNEDLKIDFASFRDLLSDPALYDEEIRFIRPYYYGSTAGYRPQDAFHEKLMEMGFDTRILPLREKGDLRLEKGVDVWLAVDMVNFAARG